MGFILTLRILRSPSVITVEPRHSNVNKPPQAFAIVEDLIFQAQALLQEIHSHVGIFLKEKPSEFFAREAFSLGLVWKEVAQLLAIMDDWTRLGDIVSNPI
jgi:hypothetical protein